MKKKIEEREKNLIGAANSVGGRTKKLSILEDMNRNEYFNERKSLDQVVAEDMHAQTEATSNIARDAKAVALAYALKPGVSEAAELPPEEQEKKDEFNKKRRFAQAMGKK